MISNRTVMQHVIFIEVKKWNKNLVEMEISIK